MGRMNIAATWALVLTGAVMLASGPASATPFIFSGGLTDGGSVAGSLDIDTVTGRVTGADFTTTGPDAYHFINPYQQADNPTAIIVFVRNDLATEDFNLSIPVTTLVGFTGGVINGVTLFNLPAGKVDATNTGNMALTPVPEPASWAMLFMGFGALGAVLRRQRRAALIA